MPSALPVRVSVRRWLASLSLAAIALAGCSSPSPGGNLGVTSGKALQSTAAQAAGSGAHAASSAPPTATVLAAATRHAQRQPCPTQAELPSGTLCLTGRDSAGAFWWVAIPADWSGVLVMHAHGGPELGAPSSERTVQDMKRWSVVVRAGHAWAGSSFRQGGVAVRAAAEDTERLRQWFVAELGRPQLTILHGQSWGASVAAIGAEMFPNSQDAVLLTSGVLGGGSRSYDFRLDLRVVYQVVCADHPAADEPAYPLNIGLPADSKLTRAELAKRVNACTGLNLPAAQRSPAQKAALDALLRQARIPESSLLGHLNWATWHFQDISRRLGGASPFGNSGVVYSQADGGDSLNRQVARFKADPQTLARFSADTDPTGQIQVPVLSLRGIDDAIAFVELDTVFRERMHAAGKSQQLVQTYSRRGEHSYLSDPEYVAAINALLAWVRQGKKPQAQALLAACQALEPRWSGGCRIEPDFQPASLSSRVSPR